MMSRQDVRGAFQWAAGIAVATAIPSGLFVWFLFAVGAGYVGVLVILAGVVAFVRATIDGDR